MSSVMQHKSLSSEVQHCVTVRRSSQVHLDGVNEQPSSSSSGKEANGWLDHILHSQCSTQFQFQSTCQERIMGKDCGYQDNDMQSPCSGRCTEVKAMFMQNHPTYNAKGKIPSDRFQCLDVTSIQLQQQLFLCSC